MCDLVPFAQFKKREKHPWRSATFSKVLGSLYLFLVKLTLHLIKLQATYFSRFLNGTNGTKSRNASQICVLKHYVLQGHYHYSQPAEV